MASAMYDSEDACNSSPPMVAAVPNYDEYHETPPFALHNHEKVAEPAGQPRKHQSDLPISTHQGDQLLMRYLAPNVPHIAEGAANAPLEPFSGEDRRPGPVDFDPRTLKKPVLSDVVPRPQGLDVKTASSETTKFDGAPQYKQPLTALRPMRTNHIKQETSPTGSPPARARFHSISEMSRGSSQDPSKLSPELKTQVSFPSLQPIQTPQGSASCPEKNCGQTYTLPSIHKALGGLSGFGPSNTTASSPFPFSTSSGSAISGNDSSFDRSLSTKLPAPYSIVSPVSMKDSSNNPSPASHSSFWRGPSSDMVSAKSPYESSSINNTTQATSYPTPTEQVGIGMGDRMLYAPQPNSGHLGSYKCTYPGCTAAPFQTQYLLNSHANVHSQDRPHFCPVEGCSRSIGGKGFKRKNEMIRHGLVHNSPGYVCPFCPDQQHRYPRPDNLQRHVRVHHVDKSKDDPILRQVLAQRPTGSARGRKRRMDNI